MSQKSPLTLVMNNLSFWENIKVCDKIKFYATWQKICSKFLIILVLVQEQCSEMSTKIKNFYYLLL